MTFHSLPSLFVGMILLVTGSSLLGTTLGVQIGQYGFSDSVAGAVMAAYFFGFAFGAFVCPPLIRRVGHIRAFAAMAATVSASILIHTFSQHPIVWLELRFITGVCMVGLYTIIESWFNAVATPATRGQIFASYQSLSLLAVAAGQFLLLTMSSNGSGLIVLSTALFSLSLIPIALTNVAQPPSIPRAELHLRGLWRASPLGFVGVVASGLANGTFFALGPVFAQHMLMTHSQIAIFMGLVVMGGALLQWPVGHLSDRFDRRVILIAVGFLGSIFAAGAFVIGEFNWGFSLLCFLYGGATFALYPLAVSHSNDRVTPDRVLETATGLLLIYGVAATVGPLVTGVTMDITSGKEFLLILAIFQLVPAIYGLYRMTQRKGVPTEQQHEFVAMVGTSQAELPLNPQVPVEYSKQE